jgi:hypothetical protein
MLAAASPVAGPGTVANLAGKIEVSANSLRIQPGTRMNYLRFEDGVRISGQGFSLRANTVEIDVATEGVIDTSAIRLPSLDEPPDRVIADPASAVQQMARDIRGPSANLDAASLKRIAASGKVQIDGPGISLTTDTLYSEDGGLSWSTGGVAHLKVSDKQRGQSGSFTANLISFNSSTETLLARGSLQGSFRQGKQPEITMAASELRADLRSDALEIRGGLRLAYGSLELSTEAQGVNDPVVRLNTRTMSLELDGAFVLLEREMGLELEGTGLSARLDKVQQVDVLSGFKLVDTERGLELRADKLSAVLEPLRLEARGQVRVEYGKSSYDAQEAIVTREGSGKHSRYILEMSGPQTGRFDLGDLGRDASR